MKRRLILNRWYWIIVLLISISASAQEDGLYDHGLDQGKWEDLREGIRYEGQPDGPGRRWTYESEDEYRRSGGNGNGQGGGSGNGGDGSGERMNGGDGSDNRPSQQRISRNRNISSGSSSSLSLSLGPIGYILLGVFGVAIIFLIYYLFINAERKGAKIESEVIELEEMNPTEIPLTDLERMLQEAIAKNDFRGAIRIYFIFIVRGLAERKWINWEKEKTNYHYLREMSEKEHYEDFSRSVSFFEIIWYGKRELNKENFDKIRPNFTQLLDKLGIK